MCTSHPKVVFKDLHSIRGPVSFMDLIKHNYLSYRTIDLVHALCFECCIPMYTQQTWCILYILLHFIPYIHCPLSWKYKLSGIIIDWIFCSRFCLELYFLSYIGDSFRTLSSLHTLTNPAYVWVSQSTIKSRIHYDINPVLEYVMGSPDRAYYQV